MQMVRQRRKPGCTPLLPRLHVLRGIPGTILAFKITAMQMKKLTMGFFGRERSAEPPRAEDIGQPIDPERLAELMRCFPISGKIRYFPEHRKDIVLESIVIAYGIDHRLIYTQHEIHIDDDGGRPVVMVDDDWKDRRIREVQSFCLLIPFAGGGMKGDLDYDRRVALETGGFLQRGETLTLMSLGNARGVPHVRSLVRKRTLLKTGYYANHAVVVLEVQPETLNHIDQRQQMRVRTAIPVTLQSTDEAPPCSAMMVDFTESSMKLRLDPSAQALAERRNLIVTIDLPAHGRKFILGGKPLRRDGEYLVISLASRFRDSRFRDIELMDALDLKATLLQHTSTRA
jgi:hypothetical protein